MPFWITILIRLALSLGLPWLESHVPKAIADIIEQILALLKGSQDQKATMVKVAVHVDKLKELLATA